MPSASTNKLKVFIQGLSFGPNSNETETWVQLDSRYAIMRSDGTLVNLNPIGSDSANASIHLDYADSAQDVQRKIVDRIVADLATMADLGGALLNPADLRFEFLGG